MEFKAKKYKMAQSHSSITVILLFYFALVLTLSACATEMDLKETEITEIASEALVELPTESLPEPSPSPVLIAQGNYKGYEYNLYEDHATITQYLGEEVEILIPSEIEGCPVTAIENSAFEGLSFITIVTVPNTVKKIGAMAFENCYLLEQIEIPDSVISIDGAAFFNCQSLEKIDIPDHVEYIGSVAFGDCISLTDVSIPHSVKLVGSRAFGNTPWLNSLVFCKN